MSFYLFMCLYFTFAGTSSGGTNKPHALRKYHGQNPRTIYPESFDISSPFAVHLATF